MYDQNLESGREERGAKAGIYPASTLSMAKPLGIYTKLLVTPKNERLHDFILQDQSAKLLPKHRVCNCLKKRIDKNKNREIKYNESRKKAHWSNVQRCGSIWACPVCAKQVTEGRRSELSLGIERWKTNFSGGCLLLTLTFSHSLDMSLGMSLEGLKKAYQYFVEHRQVKKIFSSIGVLHKIKGLEVTWGQNGWHPHNHILLLTEHQVLGFESYRNLLASIWQNSCIKAGLRSPSIQHGLDIQDGTYAADYVAKWGLPEELTKGHLKKGRNGSYTPFDLLQLSIENESIHGKLPSKLWQEFVIAMKGAQQLRWGRGLKKLLLIEEKTDEELAEETEENAILLTDVDNYLFSLLCTYQKRHEYLRCIERDYENGCFGTGEAERLLIGLVEQDIERLNNMTT